MKKQITKEQFLKDVRTEINNIKKYATKAEINRLDFENLEPENYNRCIYGQMTDDCTSPRASELIFKSCARYISPGDNNIKINSFTKLKSQINGKTIPGVKNNKQFANTRIHYIDHFSSLEAYIMLPKAKNKNIISYLKGETKKLIL